MPLTLDTSSLPSLSLPSWQGVSGLPGAATNANPLAIPQTVYSTPIGPQQPASMGNFLASLVGLGNPTQSPAAYTAQTGQTSGSTGVSWLSDFFLRSVVIILGFIFVAVGLSMFKSGELSINPNKLDPLRGFKK